MGKEEAFFFPAVRNAVAEVISAESQKETGQCPSYPHSLGMPP